MGETKNILHFEKISTKCSLESFSTDKNSDCWISILRLKSGLVRMDSLFIDNAYSTLTCCIKILHYTIHSNTIKDGYYPLNSVPVDNTHERHAVVTTFRRAQKRLRNLSSLKKSKFSTLILSPCDLSGKKKFQDFDSSSKIPTVSSQLTQWARIPVWERWTHKYCLLCGDEDWVTGSRKTQQSKVQTSPAWSTKTSTSTCKPC